MVVLLLIVIIMIIIGVTVTFAGNVQAGTGVEILNALYFEIESGAILTGDGQV